MKKTICLVLTLLLLVPCFAALAEAAEETATEIYAEPILFRGIPWGANPEEVKNALPSDLYLGWSYKTEWHSVDDYLYAGDEEVLYVEPLGCYYYSGTVDTRKSDLKVAGYPLDNVYMYFVYSQDGSKLSTSADSMLVYAHYVLVPNNVDAVFEDLLNKLTSLYGDVDLAQEKEGYRQSLWRGQDGTMVSLTVEKGKNIYIAYGFAGADELIEQAHQILNYGEVMQAGDSTDGL